MTVETEMYKDLDNVRRYKTPAGSVQDVVSAHTGRTLMAQGPW